MTIERLNPELAKKIIASSEGQAFASWMTSVALSLDKLSDIEPADPQEIAIEVLARKRAYDVLHAALDEMLLSSQDILASSDSKEYAVDVDKPG